jgi:hypothetical protein
MAIGTTYLIIGFAGFAVIAVETLFIMTAFSKIPRLLTVMFGKRMILSIGNDGSITPYGAKLQGSMYENPKLGAFIFEQEDVCYFGKKPTIITYSPHPKAIRPRVTEVLTYLKKHDINRVKIFDAIINSTPYTYEEFITMQTKENLIQTATEGDNDE